MNSLDNMRRNAGATLITTSPPTTVSSDLSGAKPLRTIIGSTPHIYSGLQIITSNNATLFHSKPIITPSAPDNTVVSAYPSKVISSPISGSNTLQSEVEESLVKQATTQTLLEQSERALEKLSIASTKTNPHTAFATDKTAKKVPPRPLIHSPVVSLQVDEMAVTGSELENLPVPKNSQPEVVASKSELLLERQFVTPSALEYPDIIIDNQKFHPKIHSPVSKKITPSPFFTPIAKSTKSSIYIGIGSLLLISVVVIGAGVVNNTRIFRASALSAISISNNNINVDTFVAQESPETGLKQQNTFTTAQEIQVCVAYQNQPNTTVLLVKINRLDAEPKLELTTRVSASGSDTRCLPFTGTKVRPGNFRVEVDKAENLGSDSTLVGASEFTITQP